MRLELQPKGIGVWLVNPGFVRTRLTAKNAFDMPFIITPQAAAQAMVKGWAKGHFEIHFPPRFSYFLKALNWLPWSWYEKLITRWVKTPD
jgi:short-subunit dehydrogenase